MMQDSTLYLCINLPWAEERRSAILAQAQKFHVDIQIVEAVAGKSLTAEERSLYDEDRRMRCFTRGLLDNEIACALSHRKALGVFLQSEASYAVVMEDDAVLAENFREGMDELLHHLHGWEAAKLYTDTSILYPVLREPAAAAPVQPVIPRKLPWVAVGYLYSRRAAEIVYAELGKFWLPADAQIGHILMAHRVPTIGVAPSLIVTSDAMNVNSTIDANSLRNLTVAKRTLGRYIRYRWHVLRTSFMKWRMRRIMQRKLSRA